MSEKEPGVSWGIDICAELGKMSKTWTCGERNREESVQDLLCIFTQFCLFSANKHSLSIIFICSM